MPFQNRSAYGEIFTIPTQYIDNIANKLYAEQKQRQAQQQQDIKGMDDMFARNVSGVRDEDIPEIAQSYNEWKTAKIKLAKNPNNKNRIQDELEAQRKMVKTSQQIGNSKQMLKTLQDNGKRVAAKPDDHFDDAPSLISMTNGVPTSQFSTLLRPDPNGELDPISGKVKMVGFDPADYNSYVDRGNVKNWQPIMKSAVGSLKDVTPISEDYKDDKGLVLGQKVTPIKATASPTSYMANMSQYVYSGVGRMKHFTNSFKESYTDDNATKIATEYYEQAKNNPLWKQAWGENGIAIPPEALANPNTRVLALNSMEYALNNPPQLGTPRNVPNVPNLLDKKNKDAMANWRTKFEAANGEWDRRRPLKFADSLALIQARNDAGGNTEDYDAGYITDDYFKKYGKQIDLKDAGWVVNGIMKGEKPAGFVPVSSIHPSDINLINGFDKEKKQLAVNPIEVNGVKGYIVKKDGDWVGDNGLIPRDRVRARNIETRMNTKFKKNEQNNKKGFGNKAPAPVKPKKDPLGLGF